MDTPRIFCITGTDTDVGKTVVTASLLRALSSLGAATQAIKPVQTGYSDAFGEQISSDSFIYKTAAPDATAFTLHTFPKPFSPHFASSGAKTLHVKSIVSDILQCVRENTVTLVEGSGGVLVPLNGEETFVDLFALLAAPVILVVSNRLGAINHALLSFEALSARNIPVLGIVLTENTPTLDENEKMIRRDNAQTIASFSKLPILASIPFIEDLNTQQNETTSRAWEKAASCLRSLARQLLGTKPFLTDKPDLLEFDKKHLWHPYTSAVDPLPVFEAVATSGQYIHLRNGTKLIDGMASWWAVIHGYNHPRLQQALINQAKRMPHVMFGGLTHAPAVNLGKKLLQVVPKELSRVFFADSGSVAVEVALKMAIQYQQAIGQVKKTAFMTLSGGYHGDTLGAMSVCDPENGMHTLFPSLPKQIFIDRPRCAFNATWQPKELSHLEQAFVKNAHNAAAFILEPIVQGAGGMWFYHPEYLKKIKSLCREHGLLLIADEIATGFGRTGKMFACEWGDVQPDIMCVGKALTGGVMSLAATLTSEKVALGISKNKGLLMHGPTFMANPLACAVACESLDILAEGTWKQDVPRIEKLLQEGLNPCRELLGVMDVRILGAIGVLEMEAPVNVSIVQQYFIDKWKVWIRPFGRLIYVMPPYISRDEDIAVLTAAIRNIVEEGLWK